MAKSKEINKLSDQKGIALIAFIPVLHKGYIDLFNKYPNTTLFIWGSDLISQYTSLTRDLRLINPEILKELISSLKIFKDVQILHTGLEQIYDYKKIIMPFEDISKDFVSKNKLDDKVLYEKVFLRWDKIITEAEKIVAPHRKISKRSIDKEIIKEAFIEADKSYDFWRQIGAVIVKDGKVIIKSHNRHMPHDYFYMTFGDPRSNFNAGERLDIYTSIHGEADVIAKAANQGISLKDTEIYVTTFPCSNCARLIGEAGIKKVYYSKGYSRLDAEKVLDFYNIEIILVEE